AKRGIDLVSIHVHRKDRSDGIDGGVLLGENETAANRVFGVELVTRIELQAVGKNVAVDPGRDPVKNEIADLVRTEKNRAITIEYRRLKIEVCRVLLIRENFLGVVFRLVLVQFGLVKIRPPHVVEHWHL